jgi:hypothetical protein
MGERRSREPGDATRAADRREAAERANGEVNREPASAAGRATGSEATREPTG